MEIVIGCDNAAVELKNIIAAYLKDRKVMVEDIGCYSEADCTYYPVIAGRLCEELRKTRYTKRGILICGTGIGMCIAANKYRGIRAAVCHDNYAAERSILSNDCNVLCLGARIIGTELAKKIVGEWIGLVFKDGSSTPKVKELIHIDEQNMK